MASDLFEWSTPTTPPPHNNFGDKLPEVFHDHTSMESRDGGRLRDANLA